MSAHSPASARSGESALPSSLVCLLEYCSCVCLTNNHYSMDASSASSRSRVCYSSSHHPSLTSAVSSIWVLSVSQRIAQLFSRDTAPPRDPTLHCPSPHLHILHTRSKVPREYSSQHAQCVQCVQYVQCVLGEGWSCRCAPFWGRSDLCTEHKSGLWIRKQRICRKRSLAWEAGFYRGCDLAVRRRCSAHAETRSDRRAEASSGSST